MPMHVGKLLSLILILFYELVVAQWHNRHTLRKASGMLAGLDIAIATQLDASGVNVQALARNPLKMFYQKDIVFANFRKI